jgi:hypothetical protein
MKTVHSFVKTDLEFKDGTLHSRLCDTAVQFITSAFRADVNTANEKKSTAIRTQKRTDRGKCTKTKHDKSY